MEHDLRNFKIKTLYNSIHLVFQRDRLELRSRDKSLQSVVNLSEPYRLEMINLEYLVSILLFVPPPRRILMLGTAAGSLLHFLRHHYPQAMITAVDIDAELVDQLLQHEVLPAADACLDYVCADAADYIRQADRQFDLVLVDVFYGAQSPPWLLAKPTLEHLHGLLTGSGALAFNLLVDSDHEFGRFYRDLRQRFSQQTLSLPVPDLENRIVFAVNGKTVARDMSANMQTAMALSAALDIDFMPILSVIYNTNPAGGGLI